MATREQWARRSGRSSSWITRHKRLAIYIRDGFRCMYCDTDLRDVSPRLIHLDHLLPRSRGGSNAEINLVTACHSCNCSRKDSLSWRQFIRELTYDRELLHYDYERADEIIRKISNATRRKLNIAFARSLIDEQLDLEEALCDG